MRNSSFPADPAGRPFPAGTTPGPAPGRPFAVITLQSCPEGGSHRWMLIQGGNGAQKCTKCNMTISPPK